MSAEPRWPSKAGLVSLVRTSIAIDGGIFGIRDEGLLESALARPANRFHHEGLTDIPRLAATYLAAITGNQPFLDGNKRAGFIAMGVFLERNGMTFVGEQADAALTVFAFAAGEIDLEALELWVTANSRAH